MFSPNSQPQQQPAFRWIDGSSGGPGRGRLYIYTFEICQDVWRDTVAQMIKMSPTWSRMSHNMRQGGQEVRKGTARQVNKSEDEMAKTLGSKRCFSLAHRKCIPLFLQLMNYQTIYEYIIQFKFKSDWLNAAIPRCALPLNPAHVKTIENLPFHQPQHLKAHQKCHRNPRQGRHPPQKVSRKKTDSAKCSNMCGARIQSRASLLKLGCPKETMFLPFIHVFSCHYFRARSPTAFSIWKRLASENGATNAGPPSKSSPALLPGERDHKLCLRYKVERSP